MRRLGTPSQWAAAALLGASALIAAEEVRAAEYAQGIYVLGNRGPLAGVIPPPGFYFESETYFYQGDLGGNRVFQGGGVVAADVKNQLPSRTSRRRSG